MALPDPKHCLLWHHLLLSLLTDFCNFLTIKGRDVKRVPTDVVLNGGISYQTQ